MPEPLVRYRIHAGNTIKENEAHTDYERALVLADFLLHNDLSSHYADEDIQSTALKLFNSITTRSASQLLVTLLILGHQGRVSSEWLVTEMESPESPDQGPTSTFL